MPTYDQKGNRISDGSPQKETIKKEFEVLEKRDSSRYGEWSNTGFHAVHPADLGRLNFHLLRHIYSVSSAVRPAVDGITRQVASVDWAIMHKDMRYHPPRQSEDIRDFFEFPNTDNEDLSTVLSKYVNDLLVIGKGAIEKVRNINGKIVELVARDAATIRPRVDRFGNIIGYDEIRRHTSTVIGQHKKQDIIFRHFTPNSYTLGTIPIIETIINEVALLMLSVKAIGWAFTRGEIPPGMLHLGEIGTEALNRAQASFEAARGLAGENKMRVVDNVDEVNWVQFTRPFREMQVAELMPIIERIVARNFGLSSVESSLSDVAARSADISVKQSHSRLIIPISKFIAFDMNTVVREFDPTQKFKFVKGPDEQFENKAKGLVVLWRAAQITTNELRGDLGKTPVKGGDQRTVLLGNQVVPIGDDGIPIMPTPATPPGNEPPPANGGDPDKRQNPVGRPEGQENKANSSVGTIKEAGLLSDEEIQEDLLGLDPDTFEDVFDMPEDERDTEWN